MLSENGHLVGVVMACDCAGLPSRPLRIQVSNPEWKADNDNSSCGEKDRIPCHLCHLEVRAAVELTHSTNYRDGLDLKDVFKHHC